jgi:hypothetical protein
MHLSNPRYLYYSAKKITEITIATIVADLEAITNLNQENMEWAKYLLHLLAMKKAVSQGGEFSEFVKMAVENGADPGNLVWEKTLLTAADNAIDAEIVTAGTGKIHIYGIILMGEGITAFSVESDDDTPIIAAKTPILNRFGTGMPLDDETTAAEKTWTIVCHTTGATDTITVWALYEEVT